MDTGKLFDDTVVLRNKLNLGAYKKQAMRKGDFVTNAKKKNSEAINTNYKLDNETEELKHDTIDFNLSKTIQQARNAKGLTQKQLANMIQKPSSLITQYENGQALPDNQLLGKLERCLGVKLRGKKK
jgi:putative transcription factor